MSFEELLVIATAVILGSVVKGTTGLGLPLTAVPVMASFVGIQDAVVIMSAPTAVSNAMLVREYRSEFRDNLGLASFAALGAVGAIVGAWLLVRVEERILLLFLASALIAFLIWKFSAKEPRWSQRFQKVARTPVAVTCGVAQGAIGISGPLVAAWFQGLGVPRERFVASNAAIFLLTGISQLATLTIIGQWSEFRIMAALFACLIVAIALPLGIRLGRRLNAERFDAAVTCVIMACTVSLLVRAI